jgi:hypothetical protein
MSKCSHGIYCGRLDDPGTAHYCTGCTPAKAPLFGESKTPRAMRNGMASGKGLDFTRTADGLQPYTGASWYAGLKRPRQDHAVERFVQALTRSRSPLAYALPSITRWAPGGSIQSSHKLPVALYSGGAALHADNTEYVATVNILSDTLARHKGSEMRTDGSEHISSNRYNPKRELFDVGMSITGHAWKAGIVGAPGGRSRDQFGAGVWKKVGKPGRPEKLPFSGCIHLTDTRQRQKIRWTSPSGKLTSIMKRYVQVRDLWNAGETLVAIGEKVNVSKDRVVRMVNWLHRQSDAQKTAKKAQ